MRLHTCTNITLFACLLTAVVLSEYNYYFYGYVCESTWVQLHFPEAHDICGLNRRHFHRKTNQKNMHWVSFMLFIALDLVNLTKPVMNIAKIKCKNTHTHTHTLPKIIKLWWNVTVFVRFIHTHTLSPSRSIPTDRHLVKRQAWQDFLLLLVISQSLLTEQLYSILPDRDKQAIIIIKIFI